MKKIKYKFFWLSLIILFLAVFLPFNGKASGPSADKIAHVILFAFVSLNTAFYFSKNMKRFTWIFLFVLALPVITEVVQIYIPGRHYEIKDIIADYIGIGLGLVLYFLLKKQFVSIYNFLGDD